MAKAAELQRLFSFTARQRRDCCLRNYELWFGSLGSGLGGEGVWSELGINFQTLVRLTP